MKRVLTTVEIIDTKIQCASGSDVGQTLWALACGSRTVDEVFSEIGFDTKDNLLLLLLQYMSAYPVAKELKYCEGVIYYDGIPLVRFRDTADEEVSAMSHVIESQEKETQQQHGSSEFSLTMETLEVENRFFFLLPPPQIKQWMVPGVLIGDSIQFYNAGAPIHWECSLATLITKLHWIRVTVFYEVHSLLQWVRPYICVIRGGRRKDYVWPLREDTRKFGQLWETTLWIKDGLLLGDHLKFGWHHFGATTAAVTLKKFEVDCTSNDETVNFCWRTLSLARGWYEK